MQLSTRAWRKVKLGNAIKATMELNQSKARAGLESFFSPVVNPDAPVDLMGFFDLQRQKMAWCRELVIRTDLDHQIQVGKLSKFITQRQDLAKPVSQKLVRIRRICGGLLDEAEFVEVGLDGAVSQDPVVLALQGRKVLLAFAQPDLELKSELWVRAKIEAETLLEGLASDVEALEAVLEKISLQRRRVEGLAAEKQEALDGFDASYLLIGRSTEACFRMAGMLAEAERVRQASRRLAQQSDDDEEPAPEADASETAEPQAGDADVTPVEASGA